MQRLTDEIMSIISRFRKTFLASFSPSGPSTAQHYNADDLTMIKSLSQMFLLSETYESHLETTFLMLTKDFYR